MNAKVFWNVTDEGKKSSQKVHFPHANLSTSHLTWTAAACNLRLGYEKPKNNSLICDDPTN